MLRSYVRLFSQISSSNAERELRMYRVSGSSCRFYDLLRLVFRHSRSARRDAENISTQNKGFLARAGRTEPDGEGNEVNGWEAVGADLGYLYIMQPTLLQFHDCAWLHMPTYVRGVRACDAVMEMIESRFDDASKRRFVCTYVCQICVYSDLDREFRYTQPKKKIFSKCEEKLLFERTLTFSSLTERIPKLILRGIHHS